MNLSSKTLLSVFVALFGATATADTAARFDPFETPAEAQKTAFRMSGFLADDAISLYQFFRDWHDPLHARKGINIALELFRTDIGYTFKNGWYVGYFFQKESVVPANEGMVRGYYAVKNALVPDQPQTYQLYIGIEGIQRHGVQLSIPYTLQKKRYRLKIAVSPYISYDTDIQLGSLYGEGTLFPDSTYDAKGNADYYFMHNYLYDGWDHPVSHGYGYGLHLATRYTYFPYRTTLTLSANDLFAKSHWNRVANSQVTIQTQNSRFDEDGYIHYDPAIAGKEKLVNKTFSLSPSYHADITYCIDQGSVSIGIDRIYETNIPYIEASRLIDEDRSLYLSGSYDFRFDTIELGLAGKAWHVKVKSNGLSDTSAVGFDIAFKQRF